jgi:hypothetical protein
VLAEQWKQLSAEEKAPYEEQAAELRDAAHTRADAEDEEGEEKEEEAKPAPKRKRLSKGGPRLASEDARAAPFSHSAPCSSFSFRSALLFRSSLRPIAPATIRRACALV